MRWKSAEAKRCERRVNRNSRLEQWHRYFAWWPIRMGDEVVWCEHIERKGRQSKDYYDGSLSWNWEYRYPRSFDDE